MPATDPPTPTPNPNTDRLPPGLRVRSLFTKGVGTVCYRRGGYVFVDFDGCPPPPARATPESLVPVDDEEPAPDAAEAPDETSPEEGSDDPPTDHSRDLITRILAAPLLHHDRVILRLLETLLDADVRAFTLDYAGAHFKIDRP